MKILAGSDYQVLHKLTGLEDADNLAVPQRSPKDAEIRVYQPQ